MTMTDKERDNLTRWDGQQKGWYEVYYLKWNDRASQTAAWIRYTLTAPLPSAGEPYCELWGIFFDAQNTANNFALKQRFPIDRLAIGRESFRFQVDRAELLHRSARGAMTGHGHSLEWDLTFDSEGPAFHHFPAPWMYTAALPKTKVLAPHEFGLFAGTIRADGREITFADAPGQQTHIWGSQHALRWAWGHCNTFVEDPDALWEGLDSQIKVGPLNSPHLNIFYVRAGGKEYRFNSLGQLFTNRSKWELGRWSFEAKSRDAALTGEVSCTPDQMVGVTYTDPDGEHLWCNNSKIAKIRLSLTRPGGETLTLTSDQTAAAEFVDRRTYPEVPIRI